ncbi:MAG: glycosyltransferase family 39 protein, partial [Nitrospiraceae bacterium]
MASVIKKFHLMKNDPVAWVCVTLILGGFLVMFINLGLKPFWADESIAVLPARNIHTDLLPTSPFDHDFMPWQLEYGLWDPATPLYRYAVAAFTAITGFSEFTTRAFSVIMGLMLTIPFYALVRKLYDQKTALLAITFLITSPTFMIYAREARHFTFVACLALCTLYYLYSVAERRRDNPSP